MLSRWKLMAGILGVSIGGLAAAASQCPKWDKSKGRSAEAPVAKADDGKLPPAGAPAATPMPELPLPAVPAAPQLTPAGSSPPMPAADTKIPDPPAPTPASALPPLPDFPTVPAPTPESKPTKPDSKPVEVTPAGGMLPALPPLPASGTIPASKPTEPTKPSETPKPTESKPMAPEKTPTPPPTGGFAELVPPAPAKPTPPTAPPAPPKPMEFQSGPSAAGLDLGAPLPEPATGKPTPPPVVGASGMQPVPPNAGNAASPVIPPPGAAPAAPPMNFDPVPAVEAKPLPAEVAPAAAPGKFRILLRVGEGTPTFEVKCGDNLMLKVACEKVDIKSPEKGAGPSEITARGKVRFAGFGAEGTCDELKFLAGTGQVEMTGDVKVQVKDKLGRVESELTTGSMKYKIDASAVGGQIKP